MAFLTETFSFAYITCTFGPQWVGLILIFFGIANSISSVVLSRLQKYIGRITIFVGGFLINFFLAISLILEWIYPNPNMVEWYIIFVIFWGIGDSIWQRAIMGKPVNLLPQAFIFYFRSLRCFIFRRSRSSIFQSLAVEKYWKSGRIFIWCLYLGVTENLHPAGLSYFRNYSVLNL